MTEYICTKCNTVKPIADMVKDKGLKSGYKKLCKSCLSISNKMYQKKYKDRKPIAINMYASGIEPEVREALMDIEMPVWEERFRVIEKFELDITDEDDTAEIDKVLALHGLE